MFWILAGMTSVSGIIMWKFDPEHNLNTKSSINLEEYHEIENTK